MKYFFTASCFFFTTNAFASTIDDLDDLDEEEEEAPITVRFTVPLGIGVR